MLNHDIITTTTWGSFQITSEPTKDKTMMEIVTKFGNSVTDKKSTLKMLNRAEFLEKEKETDRKTDRY